MKDRATSASKLLRNSTESQRASKEHTPITIISQQFVAIETRDKNPQKPIQMPSRILKNLDGIPVC